MSFAFVFLYYKSGSSLQFKKIYVNKYSQRLLATHHPVRSIENNFVIAGNLICNILR